MSNRIARVFQVDTQDAAVTAIRAAAYRFGDRFSVAIEPSTGTVVSVHCAFPNDSSASEVDLTMNEFLRELNDQILRERVREETKHLRAVIIAHTFSRTTLGRDD